MIEVSESPSPSALLALYDDTMRHRADVAGCTREQTSNVSRYTTSTGSQRYIMWQNFSLENASQIVAIELASVVGNAKVLMWKLYAHDVSREGLRAALLAYGFSENDHCTLMAASVGAVVARLATTERNQRSTSSAAPVASPVPPLVVRELTTPQSLDAYQEIWDDVWPDAPNARYVDDYRDRLVRRDPGIVFFAGFASAAIDAEPVTSGYMFHHPNAPFALLCGGTTKAKWRRQHAYTAMLKARATCAVTRGARYLAVEASAESRPILERLGFIPLSSLVFYEKYIL